MHAFAADIHFIGSLFRAVAIWRLSQGFCCAGLAHPCINIAAYCWNVSCGVPQLPSAVFAVSTYDLWPHPVA